MYEEVIKKFIIYTFITLLIIYHIIHLKLPDLVNKDIISILNYVEIIIMIGFILLTFDIPFVHKILLGKNFINGNYIGKSFYIDDGKIIEEKEGKKISFNIKQTLTEITINGFSKAIDSENNFDTIWNGYFFKKDKQKYFFALEVEYGKQEKGVLELIFNNNHNINNEFVGYYYSGDFGSMNQKILFHKET